MGVERILILLALTVGCSEPLPAPEGPGSIVLTVGDRDFIGRSAAFSRRERDLVVVLRPGDSPCYSVGSACEAPLETFLISLQATAASGERTEVVPGEYRIAALAAPAPLLRAIAVRRPEGLARLRLEEAVVAGAVVVESVAVDALKLRFALTLASGLVVSGAAEPMLCVPVGLGPLPAAPTLPPPRELGVAPLDPPEVFVEGGEVVKLATCNGCSKDKMTIRVGDRVVDVINSTAPDRYSFSVPPSPTPGTRTTVAVSVSCGEPRENTYQYESNGNRTETALVYDPALEPRPVMFQASPSTSPVAPPSALDVVMTATFTRPIDKTTVDAQTFGIVGVVGTYSFADGDELGGYRTVTLTPAALLDADREYTCFVTDGLTSMAMKKPLRPSVTPLATEHSDRWVFRTVP